MFQQICHIAFKLDINSVNSDFIVMRTREPQLIDFKVIKNIYIFSTKSTFHIATYIYLVLLKNPIIKFTRLTYFISKMQVVNKDDLHKYMSIGCFFKWTKNCFKWQLCKLYLTIISGKNTTPNMPLCTRL